MFVVEGFECCCDGHDVSRSVEFGFEIGDRVGVAVERRSAGDGPSIQPTGGEAAFDIHFIGWLAVFLDHFLECGFTWYPSTFGFCEGVAAIVQRGDADCVAGRAEKKCEE